MISKEEILKRLTNAVGGTDKEFYTDWELNKFAAFYVDKWDENTSEDVIAESFVDYWWNSSKECRRCSECGKLMRDGFMLGEYAACSVECRNQNYHYLTGARNDEEAEKFYLLECYEIADADYNNLIGSFTDKDKKKYGIDKRPQQMSLNELNDFIERNNLQIGDSCFYTEWY